MTATVPSPKPVGGRPAQHERQPSRSVVLQNWRHTLAGLAKRKHRLGFILSQSEIKELKIVPHVGGVCCAGERQHPELDGETKYYLWNRLVVVAGDLGHAWFQENLAISGKQGKGLIDDVVRAA